jgi:hypothetical protein
LRGSGKGMLVGNGQVGGGRRRWHYDDTGYYAYVLLDGDEGLRDQAIKELSSRGCSPAP